MPFFAICNRLKSQVRGQVVLCIIFEKKVAKNGLFRLWV
nr:hypothetical protein DLTAUQXX_DLTAUQXX_CDS_0045 [uncultured phage]CAI9750139.1 hypothetical protein LUIDIZRK_LUIDIZRK_CDS_0045 [uncultured phage]